MGDVDENIMGAPAGAFGDGIATPMGGILQAPVGVDIIMGAGAIGGGGGIIRCAVPAGAAGGAGGAGGGGGIVVENAVGLVV